MWKWVICGRLKQSFSYLFNGFLVVQNVDNFNIAITPKCFTYLRYGISTRDFHEWAPLDIFDSFFAFEEDVDGLGIWWNVLSNQFGNLTFFWLKVDKWQRLRLLYIAIFIFEYRVWENEFCCIFSLHFGSFHWD